MRALVVLALLFLSFAHHPGDPRLGTQIFRYADGSVPVFCGQAPGGDSSKSKSSCDACRIGQGIDVAVEPCAIGERIAVALWLGTPEYISPLAAALRPSASRPRAPPVFV